jgi:hypothetical protein
VRVHAIVGLLLLLLSCAGSRAQAPAGQDRTSAPSPRFTARRIRSRTDLRNLRKELGKEGTLLLEKTNRRDVDHIRPKVEVAVPRPPFDFAAYSPFPMELGCLADIPKAILVSLRVQAFGAYESGRLVRWGPVSTGASKHQTPAGLYHTNWRSRRKVSTLDSHWIMPWYFNLHTSMGVAFHQYAVPGRPQSFGCIRLLGEDARWIYSWAEAWIPPRVSGGPPRAFGTPVVVFGSYDYGSPPPWRGLALDPSAADVDSGSLEKALDHYLVVLQQRVAQRLRLERDSVSNSSAQSN